MESGGASVNRGGAMHNNGGNAVNGNNNGATQRHQRPLPPPPVVFLPPVEYHLFPRFLHVFCHVVSPNVQQSFMEICEDTTYFLNEKFNRALTTADVVNEVIRLRGQYLRFFAWRGKPGVYYDPFRNVVNLTQEYINVHQPLETEEETSFRLHGFTHFVRLHCVFRKRRAALLPGEPAENHVDPDVIPYEIPL